MNKERKYYGDIWFEEKEEEKQFCVLYFQDDDILLETSLCSSRTFYKELKILGVFSGLGYLSFIDCRIQSYSSGITEHRTYKPEYTFISAYHFINPYELYIKEFSIVNNAIVKWVNFMSWYDIQTNTLSKMEFDDEFKVDNKGLKINIQHYIQYSNSNREELRIINKGAVKFSLEEPIPILSVLDIYDQFQKVLQLLRGGSEKFESFSYKCMSCGKWHEIYYNDKNLSKKSHTYVHTDYKDVKDDLDVILQYVYNNQEFKFCLDRLMENFIVTNSSHSKRFTNSISAFEAFCRTYSSLKIHNLKKYLGEYEKVFKIIGRITDDEWKTFPSKLIRSRNYHVHSDLKNQNVFTDFELLYISYLIDFVIGYLLLREINVSERLLQKFIKHGNSVYVDLKFSNQILGKNPLKFPPSIG